MGLEQRFRDGVRGGHGAGVLKEVAELGGVVVPYGRGEAYGTLADLLQPLDLGHENAKLDRDLLLRRLAPQGLDHAPVGPVVLVDLLDHVNGDAYGPPLVGDGAGYCLPYPPRRIRRELVAFGMVELLGRPYEPEVALLDEIEKRNTAITILLGDGDDEPQVGLDETVFGPLTSAGNTLGEPYLVSVGEEGHPSYLREVHPDGIPRGNGVSDLDRRSLRDV